MHNNRTEGNSSGERARVIDDNNKYSLHYKIEDCHARTSSVVSTAEEDEEAAEGRLSLIL